MVPNSPMSIVTSMNPSLMLWDTIPFTEKFGSKLIQEAPAALHYAPTELEKLEAPKVKQLLVSPIRVDAAIMGYGEMEHGLNIETIKVLLDQAGVDIDKYRKDSKIRKRAKNKKLKGWEIRNLLEDKLVFVLDECYNIRSRYGFYLW